MFYDFHIHSCLSPCADDDMTPHNIINMAMIKGLNVIAITDHNSCKNLKAFDTVAKSCGMKLIYGCEIQTIEEVHVLALFQSLEETKPLQVWLDQHLMAIPNDEKFFGQELIVNAEDEVIEHEKRLLITSIDCSIEQTIDYIHQCHGSAILAHVFGKTNSIITQLGFIPKDLKYDALEVVHEEDIETILKSHPWIQKDQVTWLMSSDAHRLIDISEAVHECTDSVFERLWSKV